MNVTNVAKFPIKHKKKMELLKDILLSNCFSEIDNIYFVRLNV